MYHDRSLMCSDSWSSLNDHAVQKYFRCL